MDKKVQIKKTVLDRTGFKDFIKNDKEFNSTNDKQYKLALFEDEVSFAKQDAFEDFKEERPKMFAEIEARAEKIAAKQWLNKD